MVKLHVSKLPTLSKKMYDTMVTVLPGKEAGGVCDLATPGTLPLLSVAVGSTQETMAALVPASGAILLETGHPEITGACVSPVKSGLEIKCNNNNNNINNIFFNF